MCKPKGRSDDMMIIRGINVFPTQIETVLLKQGYTPNYQILVDRIGNEDTFDINVELSEEQFKQYREEADLERARKSLQQAMVAMLGIRPKMHLLPPKSIVRSEGKAVRIVDKRKLHD
jgi:phenylacetate-CoA ligase